MTRYELTAIQHCLACTRDVLWEMLVQLNDVHKKPAPVAFQYLWYDLNDSITILEEMKEDANGKEKTGHYKINNEYPN